MTYRVAMCAVLPQGRQWVILCDGFQVSFRVLIPDQLGIALGIGVEQVIELGTLIHVVGVSLFCFVTVDQNEIAVFRSYASGIHVILGKGNVFHVRLPPFERSGLSAISFFMPVITDFRTWVKAVDQEKCACEQSAPVVK